MTWRCTSEERPATALFACIGGTPRTGWADEHGVRTDAKGFLMTGPDLLDAGRRPENWEPDRDPFPLETTVPGKLSLYSCGPTVYGLIHIGNLRGGLVADMFYRYFKRVGYDVNYVWGMGVHSHDMGGAMLPEMMRWLWRDHPVSVDPNDTIERSFRTGKLAEPPAAPPPGAR